tara:strand:+ start:373 stop:585 length:213 start_codon:yes stop_codon:yes gene_type:complete
MTARIRTTMHGVVGYSIETKEHEHVEGCPDSTFWATNITIKDESGNSYIFTAFSENQLPNLKLSKEGEAV